MEPINYTLMQIPNGRAGTRATLKIMSKIVKEYKKNPIVRELALKLTAGLEQKNYSGEARSIHYFVRDKIRYVRDIRGVETLQTPLQTLRLRAGDCDDKSILSASLLESLHHPTRFIAVGFDGRNLTHVLVQTKIGDKWVSFETTEPVEMGWTPSQVKNYLIQHN